MAVDTTIRSMAAAPVQYATGSVFSKDGTLISYRQLGHGPAIVVLHGASSSAHNHMQLAEALADAFTVCVPDRRGHGLSGPPGEDYSIQKEVEDLNALLAETDAHNVFGVSSGGIITLEAARTLSAIRRLAVYEPPLSLSRSAAAGVLARFDREMAQGKVAAGLVTAMKAIEMGPRIFNLMPRWLLELFTSRMLQAEQRNGSDGYMPMSALAPTLHYDFQLVVEMSEQLERFRDIRAEVLLLGGSESPAFLKAALDELAKVLPNAKRVEFSGLGHAASWNADRWGQPATVAQALRQFFSADSFLTET